MATPTVGKKIPAFSAPSTSGPVSSKDLAGSPYVLYFYPKDDTPGARSRARVSRSAGRVQALGRPSAWRVARQLGVTREVQDEVPLPFDLLSDADEKLCKQFDVIKEKNMYGKKVLGIERSTFLVDADGVLRNEWRKVKVDGHVDDVLSAAKTL
jgi:peroxiredoxin Q/BCP